MKKEPTDPLETKLANGPAGNPTGGLSIPPEGVETPTLLGQSLDEMKSRRRAQFALRSHHVLFEKDSPVEVQQNASLRSGWQLAII